MGCLSLSMGAAEGELKRLLLFAVADEEFISCGFPQGQSSLVEQNARRPEMGVMMSSHPGCLYVPDGPKRRWQPLARLRLGSLRCSDFSSFGHHLVTTSCWMVGRFPW